MKITIFGNCGSGKSTLAKRISQKFAIPDIELDRFWFEAGGHTITKDDTEGRERVRTIIKARVEDFVTKDSWVSDGWYSRVQPLITERADYIIFLDLPLWRRLANHFGRIFNDDRHPELNRLDDLKFVWEIVRRTFTHGYQMKQFAKENSQKVTWIKSHAEADLFFRNLKNHQDNQSNVE